MQVQIIESNRGECKAKEVVNQIKRRAQYSTPTVAITNEIYEISDDYAVQYDAAGEGVARTTNSVEGWHYWLQAYFSGSTPNIWLLF